MLLECPDASARKRPAGFVRRRCREVGLIGGFGFRVRQRPAQFYGIATPPGDTGRMGTIAKLHDKARRAIAAGEGRFRQAAEYLAAARKQGATQRGARGAE